MGEVEWKNKNKYLPSTQNTGTFILLLFPQMIMKSWILKILIHKIFTALENVHGYLYCGNDICNAA